MALSEQTVESLEQRVPPPDWPHRHSALGGCGTPLIYNEYAMAEDDEQSLVSGLLGVSRATRTKL